MFEHVSWPPGVESWGGRGTLVRLFAPVGHLAQVEEYVLSVGGVRRDGSGGVFVGHVCGGESGNEGECGSLVVGPSSVVRGGAASKSVRNRHS